MNINDLKDYERLKREKMASLFFDFAKLTFAALVLGSFTPLLQKGGNWDWFTFVMGVGATIVFARVGSNILTIKKKENSK